ncbi:MAG: rRNA maturation RNase YbeY [Elusimicrobia bacterium]|nr:rRNA maturation RNase YbeY [Elusimicrobiota bacterium]
MRILLLGRAPRREAERRLLRKAARLALGRKAALRGELCLVFLSDREIRRLNRRFLGNNRATDVIAFRYDNAGVPRRGREESPFGDVYVGFETARRQAQALGHSALKELATLAVHGVLHLLGRDDLQAAGRRRMLQRQEELVGRILKSGAQ